MSHDFQAALGSAMIQAIGEFDGSPPKVEQMKEFSAIVRYFALLQVPHPDAGKVLARYLSLEELEITPAKQFLSGQRSALFDLIERVDITAEAPTATAFWLLRLWHKLTEGHRLEGLEILVCDPAVSLSERTKTLTLMGYPLDFPDEITT